MISHQTSLTHFLGIYTSTSRDMHHLLTFIYCLYHTYFRRLYYLRCDQIYFTPTHSLPFFLFLRTLLPFSTFFFYRWYGMVIWYRLTRACRAHSNCLSQIDFTPTYKPFHSGVVVGTSRAHFLGEAQKACFAKQNTEFCEAKHHKRRQAVKKHLG